GGHRAAEFAAGRETAAVTQPARRGEVHGGRDRGSGIGYHRIDRDGERVAHAVGRARDRRGHEQADPPIDRLRLPLELLLRVYLLVQHVPQRARSQAHVVGRPRRVGGRQRRRGGRGGGGRRLSRPRAAGRACHHGGEGGRGA